MHVMLSWLNGSWFWILGQNVNGDESRPKNKKCRHQLATNKLHAKLVAATVYDASFAEVVAAVLDTPKVIYNGKQA